MPHWQPHPVAPYHQADLAGDAYPGEEPQAVEDSLMAGRPMDRMPGADTHEYRWVFANGQLHVSPHHSHEELGDHAGVHPDADGPMAVGYVDVQNGKATWAAETNLALRGLVDVLKEYSQQVGWEWGGIVGSDGRELHEEFGPVTSMYYRTRYDGHVELSSKPTALYGCREIRIVGKTAYVYDDHLHEEGLQQWAQDFGYKLAEYPGGGNFEDHMKRKEDIELYNRGDTDLEVRKNDQDINLDGNDLHCGQCGLDFDDFDALRLHVRDHEPKDTEELQDGHFPHIDDFDAPLPMRRRQPLPNSGETIARRAVAVHGAFRSELERHPRFGLHAQTFGYDTDDGVRHYAAYRDGELVGYGSVRINAETEPEVLMVDAIERGSGVGTAILGLIQAHYDSFYTHANTRAGERLLARLGAVPVGHHQWRWAKGEEPKDMIESDIPFVYDIEGDKDNRDGFIAIGYPGQRTSDVVGKFTPGGIVEGYYQKGGKVLITNATNVPWTVRHFALLWYYQFPQMQITSIDLESETGKKHKLASATPEGVGHFIRTIAASDEAAWSAYQALRAAGGKVYVVGGAVRDALRGEVPRDIDLMVGGVPSEQVAAALNQLPGRVDLTGKRFGVYRYKVNGQEVEVALPRQDKYETGRRGEGVITVDHQLPIATDLMRRDFTVNSMAVDLDSGALIDPYGGAGDIENHVLRTTHPDSFTEDPTRIVRALAAHGRFGLHPDERTLAEMASHGHLLRGESPDALNKTLDKLFGGSNPDPAASINLGVKTGALQHLFPEVTSNYDFDQNNPHHRHKLGTHLLNVLQGVQSQSTDPDLRFAALYHDVGKPASEWRDPVTGYSHYYQGPNGEGADHAIVGARMAEQRMRALNYPVARIKRVSHLITHHMFPAFASAKGARKFLQRVGPEHADDLLTLRQADMGGKGQTPEEIAARTSVDHMRGLVQQAQATQAPTALNSLAINGNDLLGLGCKQGPTVGIVLERLLNDVVEDPRLNNRASLLQRAQVYIDETNQSSG